MNQENKTKTAQTKKKRRITKTRCTGIPAARESIYCADAGHGGFYSCCHPDF